MLVEASIIVFFTLFNGDKVRMKSYCYYFFLVASALKYYNGVKSVNILHPVIKDILFNLGPLSIPCD